MVKAIEIAKRYIYNLDISNGETVRTLDGLITNLRTKRAGQQVELEILRETQKITLVFELDLRPSDV